MPFISSIRRDHHTPKDTSDFEVTGGDVVYTAGGYKIHMFTSVGEHELRINYKGSNSAMHMATGLENVEYIVVGGGGAGGSRHGGGGGAGGMVVGTGTVLPTVSYPIVVGNGGAGITGDSRGNRGQDSSFSSTTALGGGGGGSWSPPGAARPGGSGGSGGGASGPNNGAFGSGQQTPEPLGGAGFGNPGGRTVPWGNPINRLRIGGGGGAGAKGDDATLNVPDDISGGPGRQNSILGTNYYWAGGGGGAGWNETGHNGGRGGGGGGSTGGLGGGQALNSGGSGTGGGNATGTFGGNGGTNTGGGGGGGQQVPSTGGAGGSGIVAVRYPI